MPKKPPIYCKRMLDLMKNDFAGTQYEWCEQVGILPGNIAGIKKGVRFFSIEQIMKAADLHHTTLDYICGRTNRKFKPEEKITAVQLIEEGLRILKEKKS